MSQRLHTERWVREPMPSNWTGTGASPGYELQARPSQIWLDEKVVEGLERRSYGISAAAAR